MPYHPDAPFSVHIRPVLPSQLPEKEPLRILIVPDLHIPLGKPQKTWLLQDRKWLDAHDWVVLLGDMTACYGTPGEYRQVNGFISELARPYSVVNGNHEFSFSPCEDGSADYGRKWEHSSRRVQQSQLERFEAFYQIGSRFAAHRSALAGFCLLGIDSIGDGSSGLLSSKHEAWFEDVLDTMCDVPLLVFCHFPLITGVMDSIRYYEEGRKPYYLARKEVRARLAQRTHPTFWFSGHVHFRPPHPFLAPYLTEDRVWQIHCPDSWGFGRPDNENWRPQHYDGLFVRTIELDHRHLRVITTDLVHRTVISDDEFPLFRGECGP
jgi:hypothetical protein